MKQSPRSWYEKLKNTLEGIGFEQHASCECVSRIIMEKFQVVISTCVDYLVILGSAEDGVDSVRDRLKSLFNTRDHEEGRPYLEVALDRKGNMMILHQAGYCGRAFGRFALEEETSATTPMVDNIDDLFKAAVTSEVGRTAGRDSRTGSCYGTYCT